MTDIEELRRAHEATTQGKWTLGRKFGGHTDIDALDADIPWQALARVAVETEDVYGYSRNPEGEANAHFIALAHREWPDLLDRIETLEAENVRLLEAIGAIAEARDDENFDALIESIAAAQSEAVLSAMQRTALGDPS